VEKRDIVHWFKVFGYQMSQSQLRNAQHRDKFNLSFMSLSVDVSVIVDNNDIRDVAIYFNDELVGGRSAARDRYATMCAMELYNTFMDDIKEQLSNIFDWSMCPRCSGIIPGGWLCPHCGADPTDQERYDVRV